MFRLLLKHFAYDLAIESMFNKIFDNFIKPTIIQRIRRIPLSVTTRALGIHYSLEVAEDIKYSYGGNDSGYNSIEEMLNSALLKEILNELKDDPSFNQMMTNQITIRAPIRTWNVDV